MNRAIKFRAWDKIGNAMERNRDLYFFEEESIREIPSEHDIYEVMQFTGLYDRNGVEIYEGDIIECRYNWYGRAMHEIHKVEYDEYMQLMPFHRRSLSGVNYVLWMQELQGKFEVIGNVWENPELLPHNEEGAQP